MGDVKNLQKREATEKMQELVKKIKTCMFCTAMGNDHSFETRPMSTQKVDDEGIFWFLSDKTSKKNQSIEGDSQVQLLYSSNSNDGFLSIYGKATILFDRQKIEELWEPIAKVWMTGGVDDPRLSVIRVEPEQGYYWDNKHGKMIAMVNILKSLVTGQSDDDGVEGEIQPELI